MEKKQKGKIEWKGIFKVSLIISFIFIAGIFLKQFVIMKESKYINLFFYAFLFVIAPVGIGYIISGKVSSRKVVSSGIGALIYLFITWPSFIFIYEASFYCPDNCISAIPELPYTLLIFTKISASA